MRLLVIIGAGASFDCLRPEHLHSSIERLAMAKDLFDLKGGGPQEKLLNAYRLMGLADEIDEVAAAHPKTFDLEQELESISELATKHKDLDTMSDLFKARFYLQNLIVDLQRRTLGLTQGRTAYLRLLKRLKSWIYEDPQNRKVDLVVFNYDTLIEEAMGHVYGKAAADKNLGQVIEGYFSGQNLNIFKPHGSINWGRKILLNDKTTVSYKNVLDIAHMSGEITFTDEFSIIQNPGEFAFESTSHKKYVPAIAVPLKNKTNFDECPKVMMDEMKKSVKNADRLITLGWKGGDKHFTEILKDNAKLGAAYIVSPSGDTEIDFLPRHLIEVGFSEFIYGNNRMKSLDNFLSTIENQP